MNPFTRCRDLLRSAGRRLQDTKPAARACPGGAAHQALLAEINADIPRGVDWAAGAREYVAAEIRKYGHGQYVYYALSKPFSRVEPGEAGKPARLENLYYLNNFVNCFALLDLPGQSVVLDVACGSGWVSQFFARMGYSVYGFDLCQDMIDMTRQRLREDPRLETLHPFLDERFFVLDIEREKLPPALVGTSSAIILESCLHHFVNPITALSHLVSGLRDDGVLLIMEGENRQGPINPEYLNVMRQFNTLERPYTRDQLERMLKLVGVPHYCFLGRINGWFSPDDPSLPHLAEQVRTDAAALNLAVCARNPEALRRILPHYPAAARERPTAAS